MRLYIYTHKNGLFFCPKKKEILLFAMTWMNVKVIMPSEISQRERQILYDLSYMWNIKQNKAKIYIIEKETRRVVVRGRV